MIIIVYFKGKGLKMPLTYPKWFKNALLPPFGLKMPSTFF